MGLPDTDDFAQAPLTSSTADVEWNKMRTQVLGLRQFVGNNYQLRPPGERQPYITDIFLALTTETPCRASDTAYTDARYYVNRAVAPSDVADATYAKDGTGTDDINVQEDPANNAAIIPACITATNLAELPPDYLDGADLDNGQGSHLLQDGTMVLVFGMRDTGSLGNKWYVFTRQATRLFKLTGSATKAGMYTANPFYPSLVTGFNHATGGTFAQSDLGAAGTIIVYLVNQRETGVAGHALGSATQPNVFVGDLMGNDADGKAIFSINECQ